MIFTLVSSIDFFKWGINYYIQSFPTFLQKVPQQITALSLTSLFSSLNISKAWGNNLEVIYSLFYIKPLMIPITSAVPALT